MELNYEVHQYDDAESLVYELFSSTNKEELKDKIIYSFDRDNDIYMGITIDDMVPIIKDTGLWGFVDIKDGRNIIYFWIDLENLEVTPENAVSFFAHALTYFLTDKPIKSYSLVASEAYKIMNEVFN